MVGRNFMPDLLCELFFHHLLHRHHEYFSLGQNYTLKLKITLFSSFLSLHLSSLALLSSAIKNLENLLLFCSIFGKVPITVHSIKQANSTTTKSTLGIRQFIFISFFLSLFHIFRLIPLQCEPCSNTS